MAVFKTLALAFAAFYAAGMFDAVAQEKKPGRDTYRGIMVEEGRPASKKGIKKKDVDAPDVEKKAVEKPGPRKRRRGSSTYIPPPVPSPSGPPRVVQPTTPVYTPPRIDTFGDRATRCLHSFPLAGGLGNNPTDRDSYVRQCAN